MKTNVTTLNFQTYFPGAARPATGCRGASSPFRALPALLAALLLAAEGARGFDIAKGGKPAAVIATEANPAKTTLFAARELAAYLGKMAGSPFAVVTNGPPAEGNCIVVGAPVEDAGFDEIRLRVEGRILHLTGQQPRGPLYAVYEFLERQGCGFWSDFNETVPQRADISVDDDLDFSYAPPFNLRSNSGTTAIYHPKWNPKARLNGHPRIPPEMGGYFRVDMSESSLGLNHGALAREYFAKHPEWYSYVRPEGGGPMRRTPDQLCFTNPELQEKLVERALDILKGNPRLKTLSCSYADARPACACPNCSALARREGSQAAILLTGVNAIARAVAADYPDLRITFLAYGMNSIIPPKHMKIEPNVACVYANLARDYARPPSNTNAIARWSELTHGQVYIWGYGAMFRNYIMPTPTVDLLGPEMRFYRDRGVLGVSSQLSQTGTSDCIDLVCWLYGKMAWNPDYDEWEMIDRWCDGALGAGAPFLKQWLRLERDYRPHIRHLSPYEYDNRTCLSPELLLQGYDLFREALEATKDDPRPHGQLTRMFGSILSALVERYNFDIAQTARAQGRGDFPDRDSLVAQFAAIARKYDGNWLGENQGGAIERIRHSEILRHFNPATRKMEPPPWTFRNPVSKRPAQDPFVTWDAKAGCYYFLCSGDDQLVIRRARNAAKLADSEDRCVAWRPEAKNGAIAGHITSPELHRGDDGHWYVYASGSDGTALSSSFSSNDSGGDIDFADMGLGDETPVGDSALKGRNDFRDVSEMLEYRLFVLRSRTEDPFDGFEFQNLLDEKVSALDPTVFRGPDGVLYLAYVRQGRGSSIMVRRMKDWTTVDETQNPVSIVTSHGPGDIFEAPSFLTCSNRLFLVYSTGGRWADACQLEMRALTGAEVCRNASWGARRPTPFLVNGNEFGTIVVDRDKFARCYGPGHASFFPSPDGRELWCAYHGKQRRNVGTGPAEVFMYQQRVDISGQGVPGMGRPEVDSEESPATFLIIPSGEPGSPAAPKQDERKPFERRQIRLE